MTPTASALDDLVQAAKHTIQKVDRLAAANEWYAKLTVADSTLRHAVAMLQGTTEALRDAVNAIEHPENPAQPTHTEPASSRTEA